LGGKRKLKVPASIRNHKYAEIFASEWDMINNRMDGNSFNFFIGTNGTGKTYSALKRSEIVGVDEFDSYGKLFDPDHLENHVFFDKQKMLGKIAELEKYGLKKTKGYQIILDEAQMSANAKDWNNKEVLEFSKDMTTIRSSRLSICLTMPTHRMITTDLRQLGIYQVEMAPAETMNLTYGISHSKLHFLKLNPHTGEIWRKRPSITFKFKNMVSNLETQKHGKLREVIWKLPSRTTRTNYEKMKKAFKDERAELNELKQEEKQYTKKSMFHEITNKIKENLSSYKQNSELNWAKIMKEFNCSRATAYSVISFLKQDLGEELNAR